MKKQHAFAALVDTCRTRSRQISRRVILKALGIGASLAALSAAGGACDSEVEDGSGGSGAHSAGGTGGYGAGGHGTGGYGAGGYGAGGYGGYGWLEQLNPLRWV